MRRNVVVVAVDLTNLNFGLFNGNLVSGRVLRDNGAGGGTPNNALPDGTEAGIAAVAVRLTNAAGTLTYDSTTTDAAGNYRLWIAAMGSAHAASAPARPLARSAQSGLAQCEGLGSIGTNQTGARSPGLHLHSTLAVSTEGLPLGVLGAQCSAPLARSEDDDRATCDFPIDEKKMFSWIQGLRECTEVARQLPDTRLVCVMDREARCWAGNARTCLCR